jgi:hypothetical protein
VLFDAFFPQFIDPKGDSVSQVLLLGVTGMATALVFDSLYALLSSRASDALTPLAALSGARGPGIVGGGREAEVSELAPQVAQQLRGLGDRFDGVEGVGQTAPARRRRHKLRHTLCASAAHRRRVEVALLPDEPGEEIYRQIIFRRRRAGLEVAEGVEDLDLQLIAVDRSSDPYRVQNLGAGVVVTTIFFASFMCPAGVGGGDDVASGVLGCGASCSSPATPPSFAR